MAQQSSQQEPTMEEILASIRRIISEDTEEAEPKPAPAKPVAAAPAPAPAPQIVEPEPEEEVLELTQVVEEEAPAAFQPEPEPEPEPVRPKPVARPKPVVVEEEDVMLVDREREPSVEQGLMSAAATNAMASAFSQLQARTRVASDPSITLEDIVREMMKPLLKEWLDQNLPPLAERLVREEIERVSRGSSPRR